MKEFYRRLSEKDRRRYAAVEAAKLDHGGQQYIAGLFGIDGKTIRQGWADLELKMPPGRNSEKRRRAAGGSASST
ncbi:MAG: hypothetical protein Q8N89_02120 [Azonexus sp.]|nr:hypothetical protein [Azonexus sp.]